MKYYHVHISAEDKNQADTILNSLLDKKLVCGGLINKTPARFWWKGEIIDLEYIDLVLYTTEENKQAVIGDVSETAVEEVPMIRFVEIEGNEVLTDWIDKTLS